MTSFGFLGRVFSKREEMDPEPPEERIALQRLRLMLRDDESTGVESSPADAPRSGDPRTGSTGSSRRV